MACSPVSRWGLSFVPGGAPGRAGLRWLAPEKPKHTGKLQGLLTSTPGLLLQFHGPELKGTDRSLAFQSRCDSTGSLVIVFRYLQSVLMFWLKDQPSFLGQKHLLSPTQPMRMFGTEPL